jgi:osmoprotectant transport system substrate-binding protein
MRKHRTLVLGAIFASMALIAVACSSGGDENSPSTQTSATDAPMDKGDIAVGVSGAFAENQLVAEMYAQVLEQSGYTVSREFDLESRDVSNTALENGEIDLKPEYLGYELPTLDKNADASGTSEEVYGRLVTAAGDNGLVVYAYSPANSTNAFAVTKAYADENSVTSLTELAPLAGDLTLGGPPDCPKRDFCIPGLEDVYGITFADFKPLDFGGPLTVSALKSGAINVGLLFSLDPNINTEDFVVLTDDENLQVAGNFVPLVREEVANDELGATLDAVTTTLTDAEMIDMVGQVQNDHMDVSDVANDYLTQKGLL